MCTRVRARARVCVCVRACVCVHLYVCLFVCVCMFALLVKHTKTEVDLQFFSQIVIKIAINDIVDDVLLHILFDLFED